ncbi:MAG: chromosome partitioning protein ParB, partial [Pseudomonadota bacterium]
IRKLKQKPQEPSTKPEEKLSPNIRDLENRLSLALKARVRLHAGKNNKGRLEIFYSSLDELEQVLEKLLG